MPLTDPLRVVKKVVAVLDKLNIPYLVGGSLASSLFGIPRATQDVDIVAHKLYWYKLGGNVSERQWNDALNVMKVQRGRLDLEYLRKTCIARGVLTLLEKLLEKE